VVEAKSVPNFTGAPIPPDVGQNVVEFERKSDRFPGFREKARNCRGRSITPRDKRMSDPSLAMQRFE